MGKEGYFHTLAQQVLDTLPPEDRFSQGDGETILKNKEILLSLEDVLVQRFYDSLFAHPPTKEVFREGERPEREETLRHWWRRTVEGPFDMDYWAWQARVGLLHVRRGVTNPMMLGHAALVQRMVAESIQDKALVEAMSRLMATVASIIAEGYHKVYLDALSEITGQNEGLLKRSVLAGLEGL